MNRLINFDGYNLFDMSTPRLKYDDNVNRSTIGITIDNRLFDFTTGELHNFTTDEYLNFTTIITVNTDKYNRGIRHRFFFALCDNSNLYLYSIVNNVISSKLIFTSVDYLTTCIMSEAIVITGNNVYELTFRGITLLSRLIITLDEEIIRVKHSVIETEYHLISILNYILSLNDGKIEKMGKFITAGVTYDNGLTAIIERLDNRSIIRIYRDQWKTYYTELQIIESIHLDNHYHFIEENNFIAGNTAEDNLITDSYKLTELGDLYTL